MCVSDNCVSIITNLQEAVSFLQVELLEKELCRDIECKIKNFLYVNKDFNCKLVQTQKDLIHGLYTDCLKILLENAASREMSISKHYYWNIRVSLETYILYSLRHVLLKSLSACTAVEDANLNKIMRNLNEIQLNTLQIRSDLQSCIHGARLELSRLDCFVTVLGKIECLKRTVNYISHGMSSIISSDDLLPVLIFLVIKTSLSNWMAQLIFMKQFRFSARSVHEADESDFLITSLEAAIEHIRSGAILKDHVNLESKHAKELGDVRTHSTLDESKLAISHLFACIEEGNLSEVERILFCDKSNQTNDILCHPLCTCALCERKWSRHRDLNIYPRDDRGLTPLHVAILHDQIAIVDFLLDHEMDVNIADSDGLTALHYTCIKGHQGTLLRVLHANADPTVTDSVGNTSLHLAADRGHENCAKALLYLSEQMKIPINMNAVNDNGDTALHLAAKWGYSAIVHVLLECGANCKLTNKKGQTPLAITYNKYIAELLEYYAAADIPVCPLQPQRLTSFQQCDQTTSENRSTLLHLPKCKVRQQRMIDRLLTAIVDGDTCLACYYLGLEVYRERSSDVRSESSGLCHPLCDCERCSTICESLLERCKGRRNTLTVNACNGRGETALHVASATSRTEIVRLLLDAGANVNAMTSENRTPLHLACVNGNVDVTKLLLNCATCNVDARDRDGDTPLHLVTKAGDAKLVNLLLRHGANTDVRNQHNMTPLRQLELEMSDILSSNYTDIIRILRRNSTPQLTNN